MILIRVIEKMHLFRWIALNTTKIVKHNKTYVPSKSSSQIPGPNKVNTWHYYPYRSKIELVRAKAKTFCKQYITTLYSLVLRPSVYVNVGLIEVLFLASRLVQQKLIFIKVAQNPKEMLRGSSWIRRLRKHVFITSKFAAL